MSRSKGDPYLAEVAQYITMHESYEALLELEEYGIDIRDSEDEFAGAPFRDEETKLMFAYDYINKHTLRLKGADLKPALYKEMKRLGIEMYDRVMTTSLLTEDGKQGSRVIGATGVNTRTGEFYVFNAKATILSTGKPLRLWGVRHRPRRLQRAPRRPQQRRGRRCDGLAGRGQADADGKKATQPQADGVIPPTEPATWTIPGGRAPSWTQPARKSPGRIGTAISSQIRRTV